MSTIKTPLEAFEEMLAAIRDVPEHASDQYTDVCRRYDALDEVEKARAFMYLMFRCERTDSALRSMLDSLRLIVERGDLHYKMIKQIMEKV